MPCFYAVTTYFSRRVGNLYIMFTAFSRKCTSNYSLVFIKKMFFLFLDDFLFRKRDVSGKNKV